MTVSGKEAANLIKEVKGMFNFNLNSSLFSSSMSGIDLSTYASIKNGSYKKLLKHYYAQNNPKTGSSSNSSSKTDWDPTTGNKTVSKNKNNAMSVRDDAEQLSKTVSKLGKSSLWEKKQVKAEDGTVTEEYDKDAIYKAVSEFVKDYNSLIESSGNSEDTRVLRTASNMVNYTKANKDMLEGIGISIGKDNKLSIDEKAFKDSEMASVKSAFQGVGSYGRSVASNATMMYGSAISQLAKLSSTNMYGSNGSYSYITGSNYNRFL